MKHVTMIAWLAASMLLAIASIANAQEISSDHALVQSKAIAIDVSTPEDLIASGWEQTLSGGFTKTLEDGVVVEITHGDLARERTLQAIDDKIRALQALGERNLLEDARLLELLVTREEFVVDDPGKLTGSESETFCTGTAHFNYSVFQDLAYVYANANTAFVHVWQGATSLSETWAELNGLLDYGWSSGTGPVVTSWAGWSMPTWTCSGYFKGSVTLWGMPGCTETMVTFDQDFSCD